MASHSLGPSLTSIYFANALTYMMQLLHYFTDVRVQNALPQDHFMGAQCSSCKVVFEGIREPLCSCLASQAFHKALLFSACF